MPRRRRAAAPPARSHHRLPGLLLASCLALSSLAATGIELPDRFRDAADNRLDLSNWLLERKGFLPVPLVITEPAVGYGGGAAVLFFRESLGASAQQAQLTGHVTPPDVFGFGAVATENGTKGAAAGGQWTFLDDRYRFRGGLGDVSINLDFYGVSGRLPHGVDKIGYNLRGFGSFQQGMMRFGNSNVLGGVRWVYLDLDARLDPSAGDAALAPQQLARRSSGLGGTIEHDSRDNVFTPSRGWLGALEATFYGKKLGSSNDFKAYRGYVFHYLPVARNWTVGVRADGRRAHGDTPFYMLPYISMRGIPVARFQASTVAVIEGEVRYDLDERWSLVGFVGTGRAWGNGVPFADAEKPISGGVGFRYLLARRLGLYVGMDVARSTVDRAVYFQVGNAWR